MKIRLSGFTPENVESDAYLKILVIGNSGSGKTYSAAYAPDPLFIDFDSKTLTLDALPDRQVKIASPKNLREANAILDAFAEGKIQAKTIVIDTLSEFQNMVAKEVMRNLGLSKEDSNEFYTDLASKSSAWFDKLMRLPVNVILNCHYKTKTIQKETQYALDLRGQFANHPTRRVSLVGLMYTEGIGDDAKHMLKFSQSEALQLLKDESGGVAARMSKNGEIEAPASEKAWAELRAAVFGIDPKDNAGDTVVEVKVEESGTPLPEGGAIEGRPVDVMASENKTPPMSKQKPLKADGDGAKKAAAVKKAVKKTVAAPKKAVVDKEEAIKNAKAAGGKPVAKKAAKQEHRYSNNSCGDPDPNGGEAKKEGCGKKLENDSQTTVVKSLMKYRAMLCADCSK